MVKNEKVKVSERALIARINRRIYDDDLVLRTCPDTRRDHLNLGWYYLVNWRINGIAGKWIDLEQYAREVGALADYEECALEDIK